MALECSGLAPNVEEHVMHHVFRDSVVWKKALDEAEDPNTVSLIKHFHCMPVAVRNCADQFVIRRANLSALSDHGKSPVSLCFLGTVGIRIKG